MLSNLAAQIWESRPVFWLPAKRRVLMEKIMMSVNCGIVLLICFIFFCLSNHLLFVVQVKYSEHFKADCYIFCDMSLHCTIYIALLLCLVLVAS